MSIIHHKSSQILNDGEVLKITANQNGIQSLTDSPIILQKVSIQTRQQIRSPPPHPRDAQRLGNETKLWHLFNDLFNSCCPVEVNRRSAYMVKCINAPGMSDKWTKIEFMCSNAYIYIPCNHNTLNALWYTVTMTTKWIDTLPMKVRPCVHPCSCSSSKHNLSVLIDCRENFIDWLKVKRQGCTVEDAGLRCLIHSDKRTARH